MESKARFARYIENLTNVLGYADRVDPLKDYLQRLADARRTRGRVPDGGDDFAHARIGGV